MRSEPAGPCPEPEILAAYVDGTLGAQVRGEVESHIANCAECPLVIAETIRFVHENESDTTSLREWWWFAAAAALALVSVAGVLRLAGSRDALHRLRETAAMSPVRPIEGQLVAFPHAEFSRTRSGESWSASVQMRAEAEKIERRGGDDSAALHARGIAALTLGRTGEAATLLAAAVRSKPDNARYWSDLAAARIALAADSRSDTVLHDAIDAADRAIERAPSLAEAHFNRGIALEHAGRRIEAMKAYRSALANETQPGWKRETRKRIANLAALI